MPLLPGTAHRCRRNVAVLSVVPSLKNDGSGKFNVHEITPNQSAYNLCVADIHRDSDLHLIATGAESNNVVRLQNPNR